MPPDFLPVCPSYPPNSHLFSHSPTHPMPSHTKSPSRVPIMVGSLPTPLFTAFIPYAPALLLHFPFQSFTPDGLVFFLTHAPPPPSPPPPDRNTITSGTYYHDQSS